MTGDDGRCLPAHTAATAASSFSPVTVLCGCCDAAKTKRSKGWSHLRYCQLIRFLKTRWRVSRALYWAIQRREDVGSSNPGTSGPGRAPLIFHQNEISCKEWSWQAKTKCSTAAGQQELKPGGGQAALTDLCGTWTLWHTISVKAYRKGFFFRPRKPRGQTFHRVKPFSSVPTCMQCALGDGGRHWSLC